MANQAYRFPFSFKLDASGAGTYDLQPSTAYSARIAIVLTATSAATTWTALAERTNLIAFTSGNQATLSPIYMGAGAVTRVSVTNGTANDLVGGYAYGVLSDEEVPPDLPVAASVPASVTVAGVAATNIAQFGGAAVSLGQAAAAASIPVVLASGASGQVDVSDRGTRQLGLANARLSGGPSVTKLDLNQSITTGVTSTVLLAATATQHFWLKGWSFTVDAAVIGQVLSLCFGTGVGVDLADFWFWGIGSVGPHQLDLSNPFDSGAAPGGTTSIRINNYTGSTVSIRGELWGVLI